MKKSALQRVRSEYQPKLPHTLQGAVKAKAGKATESIADQEEIKKLFPNTYGLPVVALKSLSTSVLYSLVVKHRAVTTW